MRHHTPWKRMIEVLRRLRSEDSFGSIIREQSVSPASLRRLVGYAEAAGWPVPKRKRNELNRERLERNKALFATTDLSNREICRRHGDSLTSVNNDRHRYHAELIRSGQQIKKCECGLPLHHPRWCKSRRALHKWGTPNEVRDAIAAHLAAGGTINAAMAKFGLSRWVVVAVRRRLPLEAREQRRCAIGTKATERRTALINQGLANKHALRPESVDILATISAAVPRSIERSLRDDIIGQLYLDFLDGRFRLAHVGAVAKAAIANAYRQFASNWGPASIDALDDRTGRSLIERVTHSVWD